MMIKFSGIVGSARRKQVLDKKKLLLKIIYLCLLVNLDLGISFAKCQDLRLNSFDQEVTNSQTVDIVSERGFKVERYEINSYDGTPLVIYHLINPLANQNTLNRHPMLMGHGLGGDSAHMFGNTEKSRPRQPQIGSFTIEEGDECLAVALLNNNFDVWIYESRGTNRNNHKVVADLDNRVGRVYFNYSLDEESLVDLPAFIDFTLMQTQMDKLHYTGYSESTTMILALMSARPDYQRKLLSVTLLAPVAYLSHLRGIINYLLPLYYLPDNTLGSLLPEQLNDIFLTGGRQFCGIKFVLNEILCQAAARVISGAGETDFSPGYFSAFIRGTSAKAVKHFIQLHVENRFGMYNYGQQGNMIAYNQPNPPEFLVSNIKLPTIMFVRGGNDYLSSPEDQLTLLQRIGTRPYLDVFLPTYNHLDVQFGSKVKEDVQLPILTGLYQILKDFSINNGIPYIRTNYQPLKTLQPSLVVEGKTNPTGTVIQKKNNILTDIVVGIGQEKGFENNPLLNPRTGTLTGLARRVDGLTDQIIAIPNHIMENPFLKPLTKLFSLSTYGLGSFG